MIFKLIYKINNGKMKDEEKVLRSLLSGTLVLRSQKTGAPMPVNQLRNYPKISKNWGFDTSYNDLCAKCLYCFRVKDNSRENNKPKFAVSESEERIEFVEISNDQYGITVSGVGSMSKSGLSNEYADITKDGNQMVVEYLIETSAQDLLN